MIPVYQPYFHGREKEYVNKCLDSTWISSKGDFINIFEQEFANFIGSKYACTVSNGTVALHLALETLGIKQGDEVIVPTLTYIASVNTILQTGATPIYVDCIQETWQLDPEDVCRKITSKTKAIMAVHLYGLPCNIEAIQNIARTNKIFLIEDCAEAFGSYFCNKHVGTFGDISTFSFFGNKTITTGEGGMLVTNNKSIFDKASHLKNQGVSSTKSYWHDTLAYNYRMTNICAAIGLAQLEQADEILDKKRHIALWYINELSALPLIMHEEVQHTKHSYWMCSFIVNEKSKRDPLRKYLYNQGIETRPIFYPAHTLPHSQSHGNYPTAVMISKSGINLPSFPGLNEEQLNKIRDGIYEFYE